MRRRVRRLSEAGFRRRRLDARPSESPQAVVAKESTETSVSVRAPFSVVRFQWEATAPLRVPGVEKGGLVTTLRGAWGYALRARVCPDPSWVCGECPLRGECVYPQVFEPVEVPAGPKRFRVPPRPFSLQVDGVRGGKVPAGGRFSSELVLFGRAREGVSELAEAMVQGASALGKERVLVRLRDLEDATPGREGALEELGDAEGETRVGRVRLRFETPMTIKVKGKVAKAPTFADVVARLVDRVSMLHGFHGEEGFPEDTRALKALAEVGVGKWHPVEGSRRSGRAKQRHDLSGVLGELEVEVPERLAPWVWMGQWLGVGKNAAFGRGRYRVESLAR